MYLTIFVVVFTTNRELSLFFYSSYKNYFLYSPKPTKAQKYTHFLQERDLKCFGKRNVQKAPRLRGEFVAGQSPEAGCPVPHNL